MNYNVTFSSNALIFSMGSLDHVTRLDILFTFPMWSYWAEVLQSFTSLIEFGITISEPSMRYVGYLNLVRF